MYIITSYNNRHVFVGRDPLGDPLWSEPSILVHFEPVVFTERYAAEKVRASFTEHRQVDSEIVPILTPLES